MLNALKNSDFTVHRTWQEAMGIALGVVAALSPWLTGQLGDQSIVMATAAASAIVLVLSAVDLLSLSRESQFTKLAASVALCAAPFALGYLGTPLALMHHLLGAAILALSSLGIWQDWNLSDEQLERYGSQ